MTVNVSSLVINNIKALIGLLLLTALSACGGGSSTTQPSEDDSEAMTDPTISRERVMVQQPLVLPISNVAVDTVLPVSFTYVDTSGETLASIASAGTVIQDGILLTVVPAAYVDGSDPLLTDVIVDIESYDEDEPIVFSVEDIPEMETPGNGLIFAASLLEGIRSSQQRIELLSDVLQRGYMTNEAFLTYQLREEQWQSVRQAMLDEYLLQGTISYRELDPAGQIVSGATLSQTEASRLDRSLLMGYSAINVFAELQTPPSNPDGFDRQNRSGYATALTAEQRQFLRDKYNELVSGRISQLIRASQSTSPDNRNTAVNDLADQLQTIIPTMQRSIDDGVDRAKQFFAFYGITLTVNGLLSTGSALVESSVAFSSLLQQTITAPVSAALNGYTNDNTDAFLRQNGDDFDWSAEAISTIARQGFAVLAVLPDGVISGISQLLGHAAEIKDTNINAQTVFCASNESPRTLQNFSERTANDFCGVPLVDDPEPPTVHPCHSDSSAQLDASWLWYRRFFGGGSFQTLEYGGVLCWSYTTNYYYEYQGSGLVGYDCDENWQNCLADPNGYYEYSDITMNEDGSTTYTYNNGDSWAVRVPAQD